MKSEFTQDQVTIEQAHEWYNIMRDPSVQQRAAFVQWLKASPRNVGEFLTASAVHTEFEGPGYAANIELDAMLAEAPGNVVPIGPAAAPPTDALPFAVPAPGVKGRGFWLNTAAAVTLAVIVAATWSWRQWGAGVYKTARGEQRTLMLADGSQIQLNTDSRVYVRFAENSREIELAQGEAIFTVAHDHSRPFRVRSGDAVIQALGTQFNVYRRADAVAVSVLEGRVAVTDRRIKRQEILDAGKGIEVLAQGALATAKPIDSIRVAAWREKRLVFRSDRLRDIAAEFNRYNDAVRFDVEAPAVGEKRYTGVFDANAPESFARLLEDSPELEVVRTDKGFSVHYK